MSSQDSPGEVQVTIDHLVVTGLTGAETRELVGELRAGLTAALSGRPADAAPTAAKGRSQGRELGRLAATRIARAAGRG